MKRISTHHFVLLSVTLLLLLPAAPAWAQAAPLWSGSITCQLDDEEQGVYQRQEIQTWTLTGAPPTNPTAIPLYQATWQAQAQGQLLRTQQATQTTTSIQWVANVPSPGGQAPLVPIVIRQRADGRWVVGQGQSPMTVPNAVNGQRQVFVNGVAQGQPAPFSRGLAEWTFPRIETPGNDSTIAGSSQGQVDPGSAELVHHYGGLPPTATCKWNLTKGGGAQVTGQGTNNNGLPQQTPQNSSGNPATQTNGQNCQSPATVQQTFETMKANMQAQYEKLIQGTSDPAEIASLKNQEQRTIANLNNQEQRDMALASQGCLPATNTAGGSNGGAATGGAAGGGASAGASASGGANSGGGAYTGSAGNSGAAGGGASAGASASGGAAGASGGSSAGSSASGGANASGGATSGGAAGAAGSAGNAGATSANGAASGGNSSGAAGNQGSGSGTSGGSGSNSGLRVGTPNHQMPSLALLTGVSPAANNGQTNVTVTLTGQQTHFATGTSTVSFTRSAQASTSTLPTNSAALTALQAGNAKPSAVQAGKTQASTANSLSVPLTMNPASAAGTYSITVTTPTANGPETVTLNNAFTVTTTPTLNISPVTVGSMGTVKNTAAPASAKYRAVITGLMCMQHISSGDAIYAAAVVRQYDRRNGQNTMFTNLNTWVYGDVNGMQSQRKQAGTRSPSGGIGDGNLVPDGFTPGIRDTMPTPQVNNLLPLTLWEGTLTDGVDALVISPSLWINYGDKPLFITWNQNEDSFTNSILMDSRVQNQINNQTLGTLVVGSSQTTGGSVVQSVAGDVVQAVADTILVIPFVELQGNPSHDRPVGVGDANPSDPTSSMILPNMTIVLTREIIEKRLGSNSWTMMTIDFKDTTQAFTAMIGSDHRGEYTMFIQIERQ